MRNDTPADVSFKADLSFVKSAAHTEAVLEGADACFDSGPPRLATPEPALFLSRSNVVLKDGRGLAALPV